MPAVIAMPRQRKEPLVQKVFMCPIGLLGALKDEAQKTGKSESEIIREALKDRLNLQG